MGHHTTYLLELREVAKSCPNAGLRKELRELADGMDAIIRDLYQYPQEETMRALNCIWSYAERVKQQALDASIPDPPDGGHNPIPLQQMEIG